MSVSTSPRGATVSLRPLIVPAALLLGALFVGCGDDGGGADPVDSGLPSDTGRDTGVDPDSAIPDAGDTPEGDVEPEDDTPDVEEETDTEPALPPEEVICEPCRSDAQCGGAGNRCLNNGRDPAFCGYDCSGDPSVCPAGTECLTLADGVTSQCVPPELICDNPCEGVTCEEGEICDALDDGTCKAPFELCEPCELNSQCGGPDDYCLTFDDVDALSACTTACPDNICPDGYFCANVGGIDVPQCVPEILTCIDRCVGVTCDEGEYCDPLNGYCFEFAQPCDVCTTDAQCGGNGARCLGLAGPDCTTDADCDDSEFCNDGTCFSGRCGVDCLTDPFACPDGYTCYNLVDGGAQCLPITLSCVDRCAGVDCDAGFNCEETTGECVRSTLDICGQPCTVNAACGEPGDLCLNVDGGSPYCAYACSDTEPCPIGYQCFTSVGSLTHCVPTSIDFSCEACTGVVCADGSSCDPNSGVCQPDPVPCGRTGTECPDGSLCNIFENRCEPIGLACSFETRFSACDFNTSVCTSAVESEPGTCEQDCFGTTGCPDDRPVCNNYHSVFGGICTVQGFGGSADTCGSLMPSVEPIGRPCVVGEDPLDPSVCFSAQANYCLAGVDPAVPGFCTRTCTADTDCTGGATCETLDAGSFCIPTACECMAPADLESGVVDLWTQVVERTGTTRCALSWPLWQRRAVFPLAQSDDPYRVEAANRVAGEPIRGFDLLAPQIDAIAAAANTPSAVPALRAAIAAWSSLVSVNPAETITLGESPLYEGLQRFVTAGGGTLDDAAVRALAEAVDPIVGSEVGILLARLAPVVTDHATTFTAFADLLTDAPNATAVWAAGSTDLSLLDPRVIELLSQPATRNRWLGQAVRTAVAAEAFSPDVAGLDATFEYRTPSGLVVIAGAANNTHAFAEPVALLIDLGGDDTYTFAAGANAPGQPLALVIDLDGSDTWGYAPVAHPDDPANLPSDGAGRAEAVRGSDGAVSLSVVGRQGAGRFGTGAVYDLGAGSDTYRTLRFGQGFGFAGTGILVETGPANLTLEAYGQGGGLFGLGILVLGEGAHRASALHGALGFGAGGGVGIAVGGSENDTYTLDDALDGTPLYANRLTGAPGQFSAGLGAGIGRPAAERVDDPPFEANVGGGLGLFVEPAGNDDYAAGQGAFGFGHWHGAGAFRDLDGNEAYAAAGLAFGAGFRFGNGSFVDAAGSDEYGSDAQPIDFAFGFGEDFAGGLFLDEAGDDFYRAGAFSLGLGQVNGAGFFFDVLGSDDYGSTSNDSFGRAVLTLIGRDPDTNPRRQVLTAGFFVDAAGADTFDRPDLGSAGIRNDAAWTQSPVEEADLPVFGGGVDNAGGVDL